MPYGLYLSAEGASVQSQRLEVLANNLANVDTTGFKRELAVFQARFAEATARGQDAAGSGTINDLGGGVEMVATQTDFSPGPIKQTGTITDMAIDGDGFFMVQKGDQRLLTRAGNFSIDSQGQLVTDTGYPVLNDGQSPIVIDPTAGPWEVTSDGVVLQAGAGTALALVRPQSLSDLKKAGQNLFAASGTVEPVAPEARRVVTRAIEASGVEPATEMMNLIETSRAYEANTNMIRHQDQIMGSLISRVLREG